jgi:hypothetical protein
MELKDVILSTLAEMEETPTQDLSSGFEVKETIAQFKDKTSAKVEKPKIVEEVCSSKNESELIYLNSIRERLLVLFEGFQAPNNTNIEAKVDMTLNFLEYVLATIDARVEKLDKGRK